MAEFLSEASNIGPGAEGLLFLPYLLGERAPIWNANAKGILFGLTINHGQAAMVRASLEGVVYCLYAISQPLLEKTEIRNIYATGGFARNELGLQILADTFNLPVLVCETVENSAGELQNAVCVRWVFPQRPGRRSVRPFTRIRKPIWFTKKGF